MTSSYGITGFGGYIPRLRLQRASIAAAHKWMAPGLRSQAKGNRAFCSWDEDSITMGVEAARDAIGSGVRDKITALTLASTTLPFADFQSTAVIAGALGLSSKVRTLDIGYSQRASTSGLIAALEAAEGPSLFIASDSPKARPASTQEIGVGAGAAAFTLGSEGVIASLLASESRTAMFVDHFRPDGADFDYFWEERWIRDEGYLKLATEAIGSALKQANVAPADVSHFILPSPLKGIAAAVAKKLGVPATSEAESLQENCGFSGAAHGMLMLSLVLEKAKPGEVIVLASFGQGADALVLRTTEELKSFAPRRGVSGALADAQVHDAYLRMLSFQGLVDLEWGMRGEKTLKTAFTEQYRSSDQLSGFVAGKCSCCGTVQFPQMPYCVNPICNAPRKSFEPHPLFDESAQVLTYTADWLTYHPAPPLYVGFVQFEKGARLLMEMVDVGSAGLDVGTPLRMVFRVKDVDKTRGYPRYFWKATPHQA